MNERIRQELDDTVKKNHFPLDYDTSNGGLVEVKLSRPGMPAGTPTEESQGASARRLRPAEDYTIWNSRDVFGTLARDYGVVLGRAAKWIRTGEDYLGEVVELYERRFVRWWESEKRREKGESGGE